MNPVFLSDTETRAIEALGIFQFMTIDQMIRAGVAKNKPHLRGYVLRNLESFRTPLVAHKDFGLRPGIGRLPHIYWLTDKGAEVCAHLKGCSIDDIRYPKYGFNAPKDLHHRLAYVDFRIALYKWAESRGFSIDRELHYYSRVASGKEDDPQAFSETRIMLPNQERMEIDGIFEISRGGKVVLFSVELHRYYNKDSIVTQLTRHTHAIRNESVANKLGVKAGNVVLSVFWHDDLLEQPKRITGPYKPEKRDKSDIPLRALKNMKLIQGHMKPLLDGSKYMRHFHFNTVHRLMENFEEGWELADNTPSTLFKKDEKSGETSEPIERSEQAEET